MRAVPLGQAMASARRLPPLSLLSTGGIHLDRSGFRDSKRVWPRRSSGNGGKPSQPRPKRSPVPSHQAGKDEAKGRAADEAAARRKLRACPLADAKAACFVKRPKGFPAGLRAGGKPGGGTPDLRVQDPSGGKRDFGPRAATGGPWGFGSGILRAGPGFGPGAAKQANPGLRLMDARRNRGFGSGSCRTRNRGFGPRTAKAGTGTQVPIRRRRTARASALSGSQRGNRKKLRLWMDSGGSGA